MIISVSSLFLQLLQHLLTSLRVVLSDSGLSGILLLCICPPLFKKYIFCDLLRSHYGQVFLDLWHVVVSFHLDATCKFPTTQLASGKGSAWPYLAKQVYPPYNLWSGTHVRGNLFCSVISWRHRWQSSIILELSVSEKKVKKSFNFKFYFKLASMFFAAFIIADISAWKAPLQWSDILKESSIVRVCRLR